MGKSLISAALIGVVVFFATQVNAQTTAEKPSVDVKGLLEQGVKGGKLPEGMTVRFNCCLGGLHSETDASKHPQTLIERWEVTATEVRRLTREFSDGETKERQELAKIESKKICQALLDGKALQIAERKGSGPEEVLQNCIYSTGTRMIEIVWNGDTVLELHETNGPFLMAYPKSDAVLFGDLYERLTTLARESIRATPAEKK